MDKFSVILLMSSLAVASAQMEMKCRDPMKMMVAIYGTVCAGENCSDNAEYCTDLMEAPVDKCMAEEMCMKEMKMGRPPFFDPAMMKTCIVGMIFESAGITFMEGQKEENLVNYINAMAEMKDEFPDEIKMALTKAASSGGKCLPESGESDESDMEEEDMENDMEFDKMMEDMKCKVCLLDTCVKAKSMMDQMK